MAVTEKTRIQVWGESAARCAYCREQLIFSDEFGINESLVGEVCHIFAKGEGGPRANPCLSAAEIDGPNNLMLLCRKHHKYVDDHPDRFTTEKLGEMKLAHLKWVAKNLSGEVAWDINLATLHYINVPRLTILSAMSGKVVTYDIDTKRGLHCLGEKLAGVMLAYQRLLEKMQPSVLPKLDFKCPQADWVGAIFSFDERFRTKNGPVPDPNEDYSKSLKGSLDVDPHIYRKFQNWKMVMTIDPMWITSSTAFCDFSPPGGSIQLAGLAMVKNIDPETQLIIATPLVIGIPKSPWHDILFGG
ncbi:HNH endonuclease signature motif containing protein [Algiphilus sp.]|uniref:HNH endonuclease signature motif containing protein n=1 Tax=Algiphilus sp. TaxID=1872431 RepID=UPI0032EBC950